MVKESTEIDVYNGEYVAGVLSRFLNSMGSKRTETGEKLFLEKMTQDHRSIQQKFTSLCVDWLQYLSERKFWDLRNEASVLFAKEVFQKIDPDKIRAVRCEI